MRGSGWRRVPARCARPAPPARQQHPEPEPRRRPHRLLGPRGRSGGAEAPRGQRTRSGRPQPKMPPPWALAFPLLLPWVAGGLGNAASPKDRGLSTFALQPGLCRYGAKLACCYGWRRNSKGACEATCEPGCKFGECVGPNKCRCFPGYTGKTCGQDVNECGIKPRPCQHRCVNTHGSYKCFCLSGHMLMPDATCATVCGRCCPGLPVYSSKCPGSPGYLS